MKREEAELKFLVAGDNNTGKTSLLLSYLTQNGDQEYLPKHLDTTIHTIFIGDTKVDLHFWDLLGSDYSKLRPLSYPGTKITILCYDITNPESFFFATKVLFPEILNALLGTKATIWLLGTKKDQRTKPGFKGISYEMGQAQAKLYKIHFDEICTHDVSDVNSFIHRVTCAQLKCNTPLEYPCKRFSQQYEVGLTSYHLYFH